MGGDFLLLLVTYSCERRRELFVSADLILCFVQAIDCFSAVEKAASS